MDYYEILELADIQRPSDEEIKNAYRKLALRYHPDRNRGDQKAIEKFHQVAKAWGVLSDPGERAKYDSKRERTIAVPVPAPVGKKPSRGLVDRLRKRGETIRLELPVKLNEMISGGQRTVQFPRTEPCGTCGGAGSLPKMSGPCSKCGGTGLVSATANVTIKIKPGVKPGDEMLFSDIGTYTSPQGLPGDVKAVVTLAPVPGIELVGETIKQTVVLSVSQAQRGVELRLWLPEGTQRRIKVPPGMQSGSVFKLPGKGLIGEKGVRGDYILRFGVWVPGAKDDLEGELGPDAMRQVMLALDGAAAALDPLCISDNT